MKLKVWLPFLILFFFAGVIFKLPVMFYLPPVILFLMLISAAWQRIALDEVTYTRKWQYRRGFVGEEIPLKLEIHNDKPLPALWLETSDPWPKPIAPNEEGVLAISHKPTEGYLVNYFNLLWNGSESRKYTLKMRSRGYFQVGPALLRGGDFFSLGESEKTIAPAESVVVYPEILPLHPLHLKTRHPLGDQPTRNNIMEDPNFPFGIREYLPGDEFRRIHWNATARTGRMQSKVFQPVTSRMMEVCLNVSTSELVFGGFYPELLEYLVKLAATVIYQGYEAGYSVGLLSNGGMSGGGLPFNIQPSRSRHQLMRLLEALAGIQPITISRFENHLLREMHNITYGSSLVIITMIFPAGLKEALFRLKRTQKNITVIFAGENMPANIPGIEIIHLPIHGGQGIVGKGEPRSG